MLGALAAAVYVNVGDPTQLLATNPVTVPLTYLLRMPLTAEVNPAVVRGLFVPLNMLISPPVECDITICPASFTSALTYVRPAALTAATKSALVVPLIVAVTTGP